MRLVLICLGLLVLAPRPAYAGPPYMTDDAEPTDDRHFEIYFFSQGTNTKDGSEGESGIDFNYGAGPNLQLTATLPIVYDSRRGGSTIGGIGNVELAAKVRFLRQSDIGWDVAFFPRLFLPSASKLVGERHGSLLLPIWLERDWGSWSTFGGGGCAINRGGGSQDFCLAGWALTRQVTPKLQLGGEIVHQTPDTKGDSAMTAVGGGVKYDLNDKLHFLAYAGPGLEHAAETDRYSWYASLLFTF